MTALPIVQRVELPRTQTNDFLHIGNITTTIKNKYIMEYTETDFTDALIDFLCGE